MPRRYKSWDLPYGTRHLPEELKVLTSLQLQRFLSAQGTATSLGTTGGTSMATRNFAAAAAAHKLRIILSCAGKQGGPSTSGPGPERELGYDLRRGRGKSSI
jgi:hypothetical protein